MLKNKFIYGFTMGLLIPLVTYPIIYLFDQALISSETVNITGNDHFLWTGFKNSTLLLMAFCCNLIPTYFANKRYMEEFIRGMMIPTVIYCFIWFFYFRDTFF